jgi:hypothetical protein
MSRRRILTVTALALSAAVFATDTPEARAFGRRGRTYVYNGYSGYWTGGRPVVGHTFAQPTVSTSGDHGYAPPRAYVSGYAYPPAIGGGYVYSSGYSSGYASRSQSYAHWTYPVRRSPAAMMGWGTLHGGSGFSLVPSALPSVPAMTAPRS